MIFSSAMIFSSVQAPQEIPELRVIFCRFSLPSDLSVLNSQYKVASSSFWVFKGGAVINYLRWNEFGRKRNDKYFSSRSSIFVIVKLQQTNKLKVSVTLLPTLWLLHLYAHEKGKYGEFRIYVCQNIQLFFVVQFISWISFIDFGGLLTCDDFYKKIY